MSRLCSECGGSLAGKAPSAKTCGDKCRKDRSRRLTRVRSENGKRSAMPEHQRQITDIVKGDRDDLVHETIKEEMRPVVREAITEDVMRSIMDLIALTPTAVSKLAEDLESDDSTIRQRAYTLVAKYTIGHPALVRPPDEDKTQPLVVRLETPQPAAAEVPALEVAATEIDASDIRQCDMCEHDKPVKEFVANSTRCLECYAKQRAAAHEMIAEDGDD